MFDITMDTPRSGLIRATERCIREYIQDNCERNLPLIQKLEDVSYNMWVESNTDFLHRSLLSKDTNEDDDGYIWDDEFMPSSFACRVSLDDDVILEADDMDLSSIGSSIRPCDESDCSIGYLAGSEAGSEVDECLIEQEQIFRNYRSKCQIYSDVENVPDDYYVAEHGFSAQKDNQVNQVNHIVSICRLQPQDMTGNDNINSDQDWVVLNSDLTEQVHTFGSEEATTRHMSDAVHIKRAREVRNSQLNDSVKLSSDEWNTEVADLDEWSVLSINITEYVYPKTRRRLFTNVEENVPESPRKQTLSNTDVLSQMNTWVRQSTGWMIFSFLLRILRHLLQRNR